MNTDTKIIRPEKLRLARHDATRRDMQVDYYDRHPTTTVRGGRHRPENVATKVIRPDAIQASRIPDAQVAVPLPARVPGEEMARLQQAPRPSQGDVSMMAKLRNRMGRFLQ